MCIRDSFIPGIETENPVFFTDFEEIIITENNEGFKFEIKGLIEVSFEKDTLEEDSPEENVISGSIQMEALPFSFGSSNTPNRDAPQTYFTIGGEDVNNTKEFLKMNPGGFNSFTKEIFGKKTIDVSSLPKVEQTNDLTIEEAPKKTLLKKKILEKKSLGPLTLDILEMEVPDAKQLLKEKALSVYVLADVSAKLGPFYTKLSVSYTHLTLPTIYSV